MDYVPDTSVIIDGRFTKYLDTMQSGSRILFSEAMLAEVEHQANKGRNTGFTALDEMERIREKCIDTGITVEFVGSRPNQWQMINGHNGEIDNLIREIAKGYEATLVTGDQVQARIAKIKGIKSVYLPPNESNETNFEQFFLKNTISVHMKADNYVKLKNGAPGDVKTVKTKKIISVPEIESIIANIIKRARNEDKSFIEMEMNGVTVVQLGNFRIVITSPPFSSSYEITAVRPIAKKELEYYEVPDQILEHIFSGSAGILVAGSPGAGKSTFVQALADRINEKGKIVKTMEKPRDLQVSSEITQYTAIDSSMEKTGDVLLLVRNDYTVFDEMRVTSDFRVFSDLRLAGVGMIGVVHATRPVDAIHRFIGRIELGLIPQVIDTILYVKDGRISAYLSLSHTVKVPAGMVQDDLARPVIQVKDSISNKELYEIYSFGEQIMVVPLEEISQSPELKNLDLKYIKERLSSYTGIDDLVVEAKGKNRVRVFIPQESRARIIGKKGSRIYDIEKKLGIHIDVVTRDSSEGVEPGIEIKNRIIYLHCGSENRLVNLYIDDLMILQGRTSSKGIIRIKVDSETGISIEKALKSGRSLTVQNAE